MDILYADDSIAVIVKPVGLDSEHAVPAEIRATLGGEVFPIHRLDQNVGGVMVYARNKKTAAELSHAVQEGTLVKEYVALVHGITEETGSLEDFLFKDSRTNKVFAVKKERKGVKYARLTFTRLRTEGDTSLVRIRLHTGRSHQIRVQFASRGFPLWGDHKYGARDERTEPALFSCCLRFPWKDGERCYETLPDWAK